MFLCSFTSAMVNGSFQEYSASEKDNSSEGGEDISLSKSIQNFIASFEIENCFNTVRLSMSMSA